MKNAFFYLGVGTLFTHELDAMPNHEWRVLPLLRSLPDDMGMLIFVFAHIPMFAVLIALVASENPRTRRLSRRWIAVFLLVHGALHGLFMGHPSYEFSAWTSSLIIFGGAACGVAYVFLEYREVARPTSG